MEPQDAGKLNLQMKSKYGWIGQNSRKVKFHHFLKSTWTITFSKNLKTWMIKKNTLSKNWFTTE